MIDGGLRPLLRRHLPQVHWTTVESGALAPGTPDLEGCIDGVSFWIENKQTAGWACTLRPEQVGWLLRRSRARGRCFVLTRRRCEEGPRRAAADELWLHPGASATLLRAGGLRQADALGRWEGGPARWDWNHLLGLLTSSAR